MLVVFICSSGYSPTMGSEGYQGEQLGVQISSERSTRQCKPRRLFAPRKNPCLCRCTSTLPEAFPSRGADAPTTARGGTCSSIGLLICTGRRSKGLQGASGKPTVSINVRQLCRKETDSGGLTRRLRGIDAPTPARTVGLPPRRGTYFLSKRKKVPKKAGGTATPEAAHVAMRRGLRSAGALRAVLDLGSLRSPAGKKAPIAHFDGGARNVARNEVG